MSGDQLGLPGFPNLPDKPSQQLGPSQRAVLEALIDRRWLTDDEAGAVAHSTRGKHTEDTRCDHCGRDGSRLIESLIARGLAFRQRGGITKPTART